MEYSSKRSRRYLSVLLCGAGRFFVKNTFMVKGSESVLTTSLLALEIEYILFSVRSILKNRVTPATFTRMITTKYIKSLK
jgi:hypothetical protein